jgi:hypothetical protein
MVFTTKYTLDEKLQVCNHYVVEGGNSKSASRATGVPNATIRTWTGTEWWAEMVLDIRKRHQDRLDGKFTAIITRGMKKLQDRLDNGDEVMFAKTGEMVKKQMSGKDLVYALEKMIDKRALLRGDPTARTATASVESVAKKIQDKLEERTRQRRAEEKERIEESDNVEQLAEG